jgi:mannose/fructose/N-acetylgalactosamine-specific phosphotransferase system component IIB
VTAPEQHLLRIDDRLLHGQVLVAWAAAMRPERILLASDDVAADPDRMAIYSSLPQDDYPIEVVTLAGAAARLGAPGRLLVVCGSPADARRIVELGAALAVVQVGGLHHASDKRKLLDYVYLSREDTGALSALIDRGITIEARDLPNARGVALDTRALSALWS